MARNQGRVGLTTRVVGMAVAGGGLFLLLLMRWYGAAESGGWTPVWWFIALAGLSVLWTAIVRWQVVGPILGLWDGRRGEVDPSVGDLPAELMILGENMRDVLERARACSERERQASEATRKWIETISAQSTTLREKARAQTTRLEEGLSELEVLAGGLEESNGVLGRVRSSQDEIEKTAAVLAKVLGGARGIWKEIESLADHAVEQQREAARTLDEMDERGRSLERSIEESVLIVGRTNDLGQEVRGSVQKLEHSTGELNQIAAEGGKVVKEVKRQAHGTTEAVQGSADIVEGLGSRSQEIGAVVEVIESIADETNLLALNAAIIAAQAGEHGKSFAVVADEIRELAERTSSSTKEVAELVRGVQDGIGQAAESIQQSADKVRQSADLAEQAGEIWENVRSGCSRNAKLAQTISLSSSQQWQGVDSLGKAVDELSKAIENLTGRVRAQKGVEAEVSKRLAALQTGAKECVAVEPKVGELAADLGTSAAQTLESLRDVIGRLSSQVSAAEQVRRQIAAARGCAREEAEVLAEQADLLRGAGARGVEMMGGADGAPVLAQGVES